MSKIESTTTALTTDVARAASMIGGIVRFQGEDHKIYSVEGESWYVFPDSADSQRILVDQDLTRSAWLEIPRVRIIPFGSKIGEGFSVELDLTSNVFAHWH